MLFMHEVLSVTPSRQDEVIERVSGIHSFMLKHPGFVGARIARYLGAPTEYLVLRLWQSPDDLADYRTNPDIPNWGANRPEGIYTRPPRTTRWESVSQSGESAGGFFVRTIYHPTSLATGDLLAGVRTGIERAVKDGLVQGAEVFRSLEEDDELTGAVLTLESFAGRDAYNVYLRSEAASELHAVSDGSEVVASGCYEVVVAARPTRS